MRQRNDPTTLLTEAIYLITRILNLTPPLDDPTRVLPRPKSSITVRQARSIPSPLSKFLVLACSHLPDYSTLPYLVGELMSDLDVSWSLVFVSTA